MASAYPRLVAALAIVAGCRHNPPAPAAGAVVPPTRAATRASATPIVDENLPPFNARVLELIASYPDGGYGGYAWPSNGDSSGTTRDLFAAGTRIATGGDGNHCVGITLEVFWRVLTECSAGADIVRDAHSAQDFMRLWYVPALGGLGSAEALPTYRLGSRLARLEDARPGDFVQMWDHDGDGHSAIFLDWVRDDAGAMTAIRFWSSQPWTGGIGRSELPIGDQLDALDRAQIHIARASCPDGADARTPRPTPGVRNETLHFAP